MVPARPPVPPAAPPDADPLAPRRRGLARRGRGRARPVRLGPRLAGLLLPGLLLPGLLLLGGCGGSGDGDDPPGPGLTVMLPPQAALDGFVTSAGSAVAAGGGPFVGDLDASTAGLVGRTFYSFDLSALPAGATITGATLRVQAAVLQGAPFTTLGVVALDHVDYGTSLDAGDFALAALSPTTPTLLSTPTLTLVALDVTAFVQADRSAARPRVQFRLRFSPFGSDNDAANDYVSFTDTEVSNVAGGIPPSLEVTYTP